MTPEERFLKNMKSFGLGKVLQKMIEHQDEIVQEVKDTGISGELTLKLTFKRAGSEGIAVIPKITPKPPVKPMSAVEMFVDQNGHLHEENPDQVTFSDKVVDINQGDKKEVNQA